MFGFAQLPWYKKATGSDTAWKDFLLRSFAQFTIDCHYQPPLWMALLEFVVAFVIPMLVMTVAYTKIFWVVHTQIRKLKRRKSEVWDDFSGENGHDDNTQVPAIAKAVDSMRYNATEKHLKYSTAPLASKASYITAQSELAKIPEVPDECSTPFHHSDSFRGRTSSNFSMKKAKLSTSQQLPKEISDLSITDISEELIEEGVPKVANINNNAVFADSNSVDLRDRNSTEAKDNNNSTSKGLDSTKYKNYNMAILENPGITLSTEQNSANSTSPSSLRSTNYTDHVAGRQAHKAFSREIPQPDTLVSNSTTALSHSAKIPAINVERRSSFKKAQTGQRNSPLTAKRPSVQFYLFPEKQCAFPDQGEACKDSESAIRTKKRRVPVIIDDEITTSEATTTETSLTASSSDSSSNLNSANTQQPSKEHTQAWASRHFSACNDFSYSSEPTTITIQGRPSLADASSSGQTWNTILQWRRRSIQRIKENKAIKMTAVVVGAFVVCWLPFKVTFLVKQLCPDCVSEITWTAVTMVAYSSSAINPFIYNFYSGEFRRALKRALCCDDNNVTPWL